MVLGQIVLCWKAKMYAIALLTDCGSDCCTNTLISFLCKASFFFAQ